MIRRVLRRVLRGLGWAVLAVLALIVVLRFVPPPLTPYVTAERLRLGEVRQDWVPIFEVSPAMRLAVIAAEDANFCAHWGFDAGAIRAALADGAARGGSTITQQTVKNLFLWHGRSWVRKGLEAALTPFVELLWPKRRILEVYLNIAEFDEGVFGVEAAARWHFGIGADALTPRQAALLAMKLPNPKGRSALDPGPRQLARAARIAAGAQTLAADGRASCVED